MLRIISALDRIAKVFLIYMKKKLQFAPIKTIHYKYEEVEITFGQDFYHAKKPDVTTAFDPDNGESNSSVNDVYKSPDQLVGLIVHWTKQSLSVSC